MSGGTLQDLVERLGAFGDRPALGLRSANGARWWSYGRLQTEAGCFAAVLEAHGLGRGDCVGLWAANGPEWGAAALGAMVRGSIVVPIDEQASAARARAILGLAEARLVLHGSAQDAGGLGITAVPLLEATEGVTAHGTVVPVQPDEPAFHLFTSGSTSEARGVVLTHRNLVSQLAAFDRWRRLARLRAFRLLALSPLSHVQGLLIGLVVPLSLGLSVLYSTSVEPAQLIRTIRQNRVNVLLAVPRVQAMLAEALRGGLSGRRGQTLAERARGMRFPRRRHVLFMATRRRLGYSFGVLLVGGATLDPDDERFWFDAGYLLAQGYGLTETSALVSVRLNSPLGARLGSVGRALPHQDVRLGDDGEVLVRGPNVSPGVAGDDGYLRTGDLGRVDRRGRLWLHGRKDDLIVSAEGLNIHAHDVEQSLRAFGVRDAVVADPAGQGEVHAVLLLEEGASAARLVASANASLEPHQRVRSWSVWPGDDFPRTSLFKVRRGEVLDAVGESRTLPATPEEPADLHAILAESERERRLQLLARYLTSPDHRAPGNAEAELCVEDLGLSSLDVVELVALIERTHLRPLEGLEVMPGTTVADLRRSALDSGREAARPRLPQRQPRWSPALPGRLLRVATRPLLVGGWAHLSVHVVVARAGDFPSGPCILAVAPHRHWLDAFAVQAALPRGRRAVTVTNRDFAERFVPLDEIALRTRLGVGLAYHVLWPAVFEFVIVPSFGSTREGLQELGRAIDRGLSPISFPKGLAPPAVPNPRHEVGVAQLAIETETPVVPVWLDGNDELGVLPRGSRPRVGVRFAETIRVGPRLSADELVARVEDAYEHLAAEAAGGR